MQRYIKAVYELSSFGDGGVRVCDIAHKMGLTKASASLAMSKLEKEKQARKDERRQVFLTPEGERYAVLMLDRFAIIQDFLIEVLDVDNKIAQADACAIENVISLETLCSLCRFVSKVDKKRRCEGGCHVRTQVLPKH